MNAPTSTETQPMEFWLKRRKMIFDLDGVDVLTVEIHDTGDAKRPWALVTNLARGQRGIVGFADTLADAKAEACEYAGQVFAQVGIAEPGWAGLTSAFAAA